MFSKFQRKNLEFAEREASSDETITRDSGLRPE